ncbi:hypothetical protein V5O48_011403, partial [Marasmius crinis-equi]
RKRSGGTDMEETPEEERPVKKSRKGKAPEPKPHKTPEPKPHTETGIQEELDGVVIKGKKGKDTDKWVYVREPENKKGSLQITPKKPTVPGRVSTRGQAAGTGT